VAVRPIVTSENPLLRDKSKKVSHFGDDLHRLVDDLWDTLHMAHGVGLAAPQIGVLQRVIVVEIPPEVDEDGREIAPVERYVLVNPEIVRSRGAEEMDEGCLSVPGYRGKVIRATEVLVKALDANGRKVRYKGEDLLAQAFQHEIDHLDGILYLDRLESPDKLYRLKPDDEEETEE